jgi:hypothetical protein
VAGGDNLFDPPLEFQIDRDTIIPMMIQRRRFLAAISAIVPAMASADDAAQHRSAGIHDGIVTIEPPGWVDDVRDIAVFVDGVEIHDVYEADEATGVVKRRARNADGDFYAEARLVDGRTMRDGLDGCIGVHTDLVMIDDNKAELREKLQFWPHDGKSVDIESLATASETLRGRVVLKSRPRS